MPKTASAPLLAHMAAGGRAALLVKITRQDGVVVALTDANADITFASVTYKAGAGFERANLSADVTTNPASTEMTVPMDSTTPVLPQDVRAGAYDMGRVLIQLVNPDDLTMNSMILPGGLVGEVTPSDHSCKFEILGLIEFADRGIVDSAYPDCDADFADLHTDNRCKLDPANFTVTGSVTAVTDPTGIFTINNSGPLPHGGNFNEGLITFTSGLNNNRALEVRTAVLVSGNSYTIQLQLPAPSSVQVGDTYSILAGCDKTLGTCRDVYNNVVNRRAFDFISGLDSLVATPDTQ